MKCEGNKNVLKPLRNADITQATEEPHCTLSGVAGCGPFESSGGITVVWLGANRHQPQPEGHGLACCDSNCKNSSESMSVA